MWCWWKMKRHFGETFSSLCLLIVPCSRMRNDESRWRGACFPVFSLQYNKASVMSFVELLFVMLISTKGDERQANTGKYSLTYKWVAGKWCHGCENASSAMFHEHNLEIHRHVEMFKVGVCDLFETQIKYVLNKKKCPLKVKCRQPALTKHWWKTLKKIQAW